MNLCGYQAPRITRAEWLPTHCLWEKTPPKRFQGEKIVLKKCIKKQQNVTFVVDLLHLLDYAELYVFYTHKGDSRYDPQFVDLSFVSSYRHPGFWRQSRRRQRSNRSAAAPASHSWPASRPSAAAVAAPASHCRPASRPSAAADSAPASHSRTASRPSAAADSASASHSWTASRPSAAADSAPARHDYCQRSIGVTCFSRVTALD
jgi:hypothetical protein